MQQRIVLLALCAMLAGFASPTRAQFICHVADGFIGQDSQSSYWYTALSCKGNNVVVAADVIGNIGLDTGYYLAFLFSTDGGKSWRVERQGLPVPTWDHAPNVSTIERIDSLNMLAFGDSDLLVRTTDAGATWQVLVSPTKHILEGMSFSDASHGMLLAADTVQGTYVTSDGGVSWSPVAFTRIYGWRGHDYGNGRYAIFAYGSGVLYTTKDNWNTVDSSGPIVTDSSRTREYVFGNCSFGAGDTMLAYGSRYCSLGRYPCIARTTDGGKQWTMVHDDTSSIWYSGLVYYFSDIDRDTILAGWSYNPGKVMWSTNRGATWKPDTLIVDNSGFSGYRNVGIGLNAEGKLLSAYLDQYSSWLIVGQRANASVNTGLVGDAEVALYPNPAATMITLTGSILGGRLHLLDILGREVMSRSIPMDGTITLDVAQLPRGMYEVMIERDGQMIPVGKVALVGK
ncbi:MAG: T9SS type A sorting domain-containing protein [Bacteroidota bacterium]|nr:T9SS type A sorting domain-containing protein [Bacteroidota bacterium]MDP4234732.1 T9SS type A sorting domain-containing protein [Bacteroidota bacterium]MDP4242624.1 T9SS type A sorting domain-containing protein [Bacteroidota bacterium]MDP4286814.1 T9SS type A sorting domain-containing protein [Bacteroidota bacterium]